MIMPSTLKLKINDEEIMIKEDSMGSDISISPDKQIY